ncbi:tryptophan synthase beta subunit-like PLP-dependent enzyme [Aspergillus sclerotioniger CBS 115572]|uniref:Threonine synthase n=1 Tax=Aspergillus sclerotioniger CBS 115572 TaxID=1450535 RepID=A0A317WSU7_9EURO|nr:tryptophan synthase beta subunit-like PLP-dependent enzyme [Aspergillus sclerotioniger CBS 115572]PWY87988.1 tryptophan synthase beta subunit-like PLP-dependent enzyme [Aspergillus sclerotioniger CBS 115572]
MSHTLSQKYLSTRGGSYGLSFEEVVLKGLASDGGLFIPEEIPTLPASWESEWRDLSFEELAFKIMSLYISESEIPSEDLKDIINRSYATFRHPERTPCLGNLFEYFLVRKNQGKEGKDRHHLTVVGATSGDTGSAAIYGLRGKKDVSVFILFPNGKVSPIQQAQMTTILDANVHNLTVEGTFDDCQDFVKAMFADPELNSTHNLAAINSINFARILAQITYYFYSYLSLTKTPGYNSKMRFVVPSGNFGDILAGWFAKRMGLPAEKLVIATNENDILDRFFRTGGTYSKGASNGAGVKETHSPAMDILVSSNFERLIWFLAFQTSEGSTAEERRKQACENVSSWLDQLKTQGTFTVPRALFEAAQVEFESERVSNDETIAQIRSTYQTCFPSNLGPGSAKSSKTGGYILDPHTAIGVAASLRSIERNPGVSHISLSTAHPAKFASAVDLALRAEDGYDFTEVLPQEFIGLEQRESRVTAVGPGAGWQEVREIVKAEVEQELEGKR